MWSPGDRVNLCRTERGWSQRELAEKIVGLKMDPNMGDSVYEKRLRAAQTQVSAWENGLYEPSVTSARQLAEVFSVSVEWLLSGKITPELQRSTLPLLEPLIFLESGYAIEHPYYPKEALDAGLPVSVPEKLSEKADFLIKAPNNFMSFDGIWKGDYVAIHQYGPDEVDDGQAYMIEIGSGKIFLVFVWEKGEPSAHYLARVRHIEGACGITLVFNSIEAFPVTFIEENYCNTAIIGEVCGWIHFENPQTQKPAIFNASALTHQEGPGVPPSTS